MKFLHGYYPGFWEAFEKRGLIDNNSGIRFCQSIDIDEKLKFNNLAAKDGILYNLIKELKCPLYIDRLQGGCFFEGYDYDMELVNEYREMLGDNFLGFQMHEWMSNFISDTDKLVRGKCPVPWTEKNIIETIKKEFNYEHVFTEAMSPAEMAEAGYITDADKYLDTMKKLFEKRQKYTNGMLVPCDSAILAYSLEFKRGAKRVMPEIGHQTPHTYIQVAYARGMAKAYGREFGTYYEPWGGEPFSACNYHEKSENEWNIKQESFPFHTAGGNGGSSRSLQMRLMLYSYLSGATFFSEEWGLFNTFNDHENFELSQYGLTKFDFIRFMQKYPDIGETVAPIALVIPEEIEALDTIDKNMDDWYSFVPSQKIKNLLSTVRNGLLEIYSHSDFHGNENGNLVNMILPDAFDIVNEDVYDESRYLYTVNLTGKKEFEINHSKCISVDRIQEKLDEILPCKVAGGLHHFVNRNASGQYYLTIFNNTGIIRSVERGELKMDEAEKTVSVTVKDNRQLTMLEGDSKIVYENGKYFITVPAGGYFFAKF